MRETIKHGQTSTADIEVQVRIYNHRMREYARRAREVDGMTTREMCDEIGVSLGDWYALASLRKSPLLKFDSLGGSAAKRKTPWRKAALRIARALLVTPDELWPDAVLQLKERERTFYLDASQLQTIGGSAAGYLPADPVERKEMQRDVGAMLDTLTPRERQVIEMRFGFGVWADESTLEDVAEQVDLTRERVRQIEAKALRKLRHPARAKHLKPHVA